LERHRLLISGRIAPGSEGSEPAPGPVIVATQVSVHPATGSASFQATVVEVGRAPVVLAESDLGIPPRGWELRGSGLWVDHVLETPYRHWSYGLEAFALAIDDPRELLGAGLGERIPLGWELEFECDQEPEGAGPTGYRQIGEGHGLLLIGRRRLEIEGPACRSHRWGRPGPDEDQIRLGQARPPAQIRSGPGQADDDPVTPLALPAPDGVWCVTVEADGACRAGTVPGDQAVSG
jgi:hypothetical protein